MFYYQTCYITGSSAFLLDDSVEFNPPASSSDDEVFWDVPQDVVIRLALGHSSEELDTYSIFADRHLTEHLPLAA